MKIGFTVDNWEITPDDSASQCVLIVLINVRQARMYLFELYLYAKFNRPESLILILFLKSSNIVDLSSAHVCREIRVALQLPFVFLTSLQQNKTIFEVSKQKQFKDFVFCVCSWRLVFKALNYSTEHVQVRIAQGLYSISNGHELL